MSRSRPSPGSAVEHVVTAILGRSSPQPDASSDGDLELAAQDLLSAFERRDVTAFIDAFKAMVSLCDAAAYDEPEPGFGE